MAKAPASIKCRTLRHAGELNDGIASINDISVLQYNILADSAIPREDQGAGSSENYQYCPKEFRYMDSK